jgi:hypothetical protein
MSWLGGERGSELLSATPPENVLNVRQVWLDVLSIFMFIHPYIGGDEFLNDPTLTPALD